MDRGAAFRARSLLSLATTFGIFRQTQCRLVAFCYLNVALVLAGRAVVGACSCFRMSLVRSRAIPARGSVRILRDTCSVLVHKGQIELALNIALSSRLAEPGGR